MKEMGISEFATHLGTLPVASHAANRKGLEIAARLVERTAKKKIGEYQDAAGPFVGWAELADSTKDDRVRLGFAENDPLLRTGELRAAITHESEMGVTEGTAIIGVKESSPVADIAEWQELGTVKIPPRSFLGGAAADCEEKIHEILGRAAVAALVGEEVFEGSLPIFGKDE
jgi:hypothetical protein